MKKISTTRECEVKYEIRNSREKVRLLNKIKQKGFKLIKEQLEADFIPDVKNFLCRKNGLLLRVRGIFGRTNDILLTLKTKRKNGSKKIKDNNELQYLLSKPDLKIFKEINRMLKKSAGRTLSDKIHQFTDFYQLKKFVIKAGFDQHRIFLEKKRVIYQKDKIIITLDQLPQKLGLYLEIETPTPRLLEKTIRNLGLPRNRATVKDYGDILKEKKSGLPEIERRTGVFSMHQ